MRLDLIDPATVVSKATRFTDVDQRSFPGCSRDARIWSTDHFTFIVDRSESDPDGIQIMAFNTDGEQSNWVLGWQPM